MSKNGDTNAFGWPSITPSPASPARLRQCSSDTSPRQLRKFASAAAASCSPTTRPSVVAEQFGTLESLYPGRIDLGLGRAPGGDFHTMHALRRDSKQSGEDFAYLLEELQTYLGPEKPNQTVRAYPAKTPTSPSRSSVPATSAHASPPSEDSPSPLPLTSLPSTSTAPPKCTAKASSPVPPNPFRT